MLSTLEFASLLSLVFNSNLLTFLKQAGDQPRCFRALHSIFSSLCLRNFTHSQAGMARLKCNKGSICNPPFYQQFALKTSTLSIIISKEPSMLPFLFCASGISLTAKLAGLASSATREVFISPHSTSSSLLNLFSTHHNILVIVSISSIDSTLLHHHHHHHRWSLTQQPDSASWSNNATDHT